MSNSLNDILSSLQNGVIAINNLIQSLKTVTSVSSGVITVRLTTISS